MTPSSSPSSMSEDLLAKVVAERNSLKERIAANKEKEKAAVEAAKAEVVRLKADLKDAEKREFNALVDAKYYKAECSRHIAQRNLAMARVKELEATIDSMKKVVNATA